MVFAVLSSLASRRVTVVGFSSATGRIVRQQQQPSFFKSRGFQSDNGYTYKLGDYGRVLFRHVGVGLSDSNNINDSGESITNGASSSAATSSWEEYKNPNNANDQVVSAISANGGIKVTVATVRNLLNEIMILQTMSELPADAFGRAATCMLLMSNGMQLEQTVQVTMNGDGPLRGVVAIASGKGEVRGYVGNPSLGGDFLLTEAIGKGSVQIVKSHPDWPRPYNGITEIKHGDIDRDMGLYLAESEQRSCALAAATSVNGILCTAAGGYLVERLPDCDDDTMKQVELNLATLVQKDGGDALPANLLQSGVTPMDICEILLHGLGMEPLQQIEPKLICECTEDRLFRALRLLPKEEVDSILENQEQIEARCQFCGKEYRMGPDEVRKKFATSTGDPSKDEDFFNTSK